MCARSQRYGWMKLDRTVTHFASIPSMSSKKVKKMLKPRTIYVDDYTWERAKLFAEFNDTRRNTLILKFLTGLRFNVDARKTVNARLRAVNPKYKYKNVTHLADVRRIAKHKRWEPCKHEFTKTLRIGTFCIECGIKLSTEEFPSEGTAPQHR